MVTGEPIRLCSAILVAAALIAVVVPAHAVGFRLGAQVIGSSSSLRGDLPDEGSWEGTSGVGGGLVAELTFNRDVSISLQPAYAPRGGREVFMKRRWVIGFIDYELNYVTVPLIVRVAGAREGVRGFVTAGLDFSFLVDATAKTDSTSQDISGGLDGTTIGALFGAGVMVPVSKHFLTFELRYVQGLDDIVDRDASTDTGMASPSVKYRDINLIVGFLFTLGGD